MNMVVFAMDQRLYNPTYDMMALKKVEKIAHFQELCYFSHGRTISFSDGSSNGEYPIGLTCCLANLYKDIRFPDPIYARGFSGDRCWNWNELYTGWYWTKNYLEDVEKKIVEEPKPLLEEGTDFLKDAQWCILRGKDNTALVAKGGNNNEPHNHNDVGSFLYLADGEALLEDLGSGEYTKKYFSDERYEIFCTRGKGHNMPIIGGVDQKAGSKYRADAFERKDENTILISFAKAYDVSSVDTVLREISFEKETGSFTVRDHVVCDADVPVFENLVTRYPVTVHTGQDHKNKVVIHGERHKLVIEFGEAAGAVLVTKEPHVNHEAQDELVNRISWEVLHNEQNVDCKMYFYLEQPDK